MVPRAASGGPTSALGHLALGHQRVDSLVGEAVLAQDPSRVLAGRHAVLDETGQQLGGIETGGRLDELGVEGREVADPRLGVGEALVDQPVGLVWLAGSRDLFCATANDHYVNLPVRGRAPWMGKQSGAPASASRSWRGEFSYFADAARFRDCATQKSWPVAQEGAYLETERGYGERRSAPGAPLMVPLRGAAATTSAAATSRAAIRSA